MAENSKIDWCDHTHNHWIGCTKVSPGCANCYAEKLNARFGHDNFGAGKPRRLTTKANRRKPLRWNRDAEIKFNAWEKFKQAHPGLTDHQLKTQGFIKPRRPKVFCASMADVFDDEVPKEWRYDLFNLILSTPYLDWLLLTKRIGNVKRHMDEILPPILKEFPADHPLVWPWDHVWLGITVCNQEEANRDIPKLLDTPAFRRFISCEPLLGPIDIEKAGAWRSEILGIDWVIVGGESGHNARPMYPQWARKIRDDCDMFSTPFMLKQNGEWANLNDMHFLPSMKAQRWVCNNKIGPHPDDPLEMVYRVGKKAAGRLLDGVEHMEVPS